MGQFEIFKKCKNGKKKEVKLCAKGVGCYLLGDDDTYTIEYDLPDKIQAPVSKNDVIGNVKVYINTEIIEQYDICAAEAIKERKMTFFKNKINAFFTCFF